MKVFVLMREVPYTGEAFHGVYFSPEAAFAQAVKMEGGDLEWFVTPCGQWQADSEDGDTYFVLEEDVRK